MCLVNGVCDRFMGYVIGLWAQKLGIRGKFVGFEGKRLGFTGASIGFIRSGLLGS